MVLYGKPLADSDEMAKIKCYKTKPPKLNSDKLIWDCLNIPIDGKTHSFYFRYTGNFFFNYRGTWYKAGYDGTGGNNISFEKFPHELLTSEGYINEHTKIVRAIEETSI